MIHLTNNPLICKVLKLLVISAPERFEFNLELSCLSKRPTRNKPAYSRSIETKREQQI